MFHRAEHKAGFTVLDNSFLRKNSGLSLGARGLLATILSLPDDWVFSEAGLCRIVPDGKRRVHSALVELERAGYVVRSSQGRDQAGRMTPQEWDIFESPQVMTDAQNVSTAPIRQKRTNPKVIPDTQNVTADLTSDNASFPQIATDARLPLADNAPQVSIKEKIRNKNGADIGADETAPNPRPVCPECGCSDDVTYSDSCGLFSCSCGTAWSVTT